MHGRFRRNSYTEGTATEIVERLFALQDREYAQFQSKLTPNADPALFIGVRVPAERKLAAELLKTEPAAVREFLSVLPHRCFDENMLHGLLISETKEFERCVEEVEAFLPFVDKRAVCDTMSPKCFRAHKTELLPVVRARIGASEEYTVRFGLETLMRHYLDGAFRVEYSELAAAVRSDKYFVNMMIAWFFATALAKQWDDAIAYLENGRLDDWVHRKTIQKACESLHLTGEQKTYLRGLK